MTTFSQFATKAKMRHDFSDQIQVRYRHPNGEDFDTWISGEEVMARLKTASREQLIKSFSQLNLEEAKEAGRREAEKGEEILRDRLKNKLADIVSDNVGGNLFGDTLADNIRGIDSNEDPYERQKQQWQNRLHDPAFRMVALRLAWSNLEGTFPDEGAEPLDDWI